MRKRIVITGLGPVSPVGMGKEAFWDALIHGESGISAVTRFDASKFPSRIAGEVKGFKPEEFMTRKTASTAARFAQLSVAAARLAFEDSGIELNGMNPYRIGACMGSSALAIGDVVEKQLPRYLTKGVKFIHPLTCVDYTTHMATAYVPIELSIKGPNTTISSGCSTALDAINWGCEQIFNGKADVIIAGAGDATIFPFLYGTFCAVRVLSKRNDEPERASRPYDKERDGMVLSEAGAAVVLEEKGYARARGAKIYAEILGFSTVSEASETVVVEMSGKSIAKAVKLALDNANIKPSDIDYINAHGNSMIDYDISETNGFKLAFGEHAYRIPISSIKSMVGQSLAPSPGLQLISSCLTIKNGIIPPTINYEYPDPACDLDYVPNKARYNRTDRVLMNSHSVGGTHSILIIGRVEEE